MVVGACSNLDTVVCSCNFASYFSDIDSSYKGGCGVIVSKLGKYQGFLETNERQEALLLKAENGLLFQALNKVDSLEKRIAELEQVIVAINDMLCCCMPDNSFYCDDRRNCPDVKNKDFKCPLVTIHSFKEG
jgi:hypothetical protein